MNNADYINIFVENQSKNSVSLQELKLHENSTSIIPQNDNDEQGEAIRMSEYYTFTHQCGNLPIELKSGDHFGFVVKVKPNYVNITNSSDFIPDALCMY